MAKGSWIRIGAVKMGLDAKTVNQIITEALGKKAVSITQKPEFRQRIGEAYIDAVTPFVPKKTGALRQSARATTDGRVYWTAISSSKTEDEDGELGESYNYAYSTYDPKGVRWPDGEYKKPTTKGTYPRWTEKVRPGTAEYEAFANNIKTMIIEEFAKDE